MTDLETHQSRLELQSVVPKKKIPSVFQYSVYFEKIQVSGDTLSISM